MKRWLYQIGVTYLKIYLNITRLLLVCARVDSAYTHGLTVHNMISGIYKKDTSTHRIGDIYITKL